MTSRFTGKIGPLTSLGAVAVLVTACGGGSAKVAATGSQPAGQAGAASQSATPDAASANPVKATGGGAFCKAIAASMNAQSLQTAATAGDAKTQIETERAQERQAMSIAPSALKPDLQVLVAASDVMFNALAKANYDYSKLTADDMAAFSSPQMVAAEQHLVSYLKDTCGITLGNPAAAAAVGSAEASDSQPDASNAAADVGAACALATVDEVSAGTGKPMKVSGGAGDICVYAATDDDSFTVYLKIYPDMDSMGSMTQLESESSDHLDGLGDDAFWNKITGTLFVRKGTRGFSFTQPSLANLTSQPDVVKSNMVTLGTAAAARF